MVITSTATPNSILTVKYFTNLLITIVQAWKDLDFMTSFRKDTGYDPFLVSTEMTMQRASLQNEAKTWLEIPHHHIQPDLLDQLKRMDSLCGLCPPGDQAAVVRMGGGTMTMRINKKWIDDCTKKGLMAIIGGSFLIAPMLIMVLHPGTVTSLITTSVSVFTFGLAMSLSPFLDRPFDVLSATAAYAAVLVVFIGTGGGS